jgi:hypothetical protein
VLLGRFGRADLKGFLKSIGTEACQKTIIKMTEEIFSGVYRNDPDEKWKSNTHTLFQVTWIIDMA